MDTPQWVPADPRLAEAWYEWRQHPTCLAYNPVDNQAPEILAERLKKAGHDLSKWKTIPYFRWFLKRKDALLGTVSLDNLEVRMKTAEIGFQINPEYYRKGYGTLALQWITQEVFSKTPLFRLYGTVTEGNEGSYRCMERAGFIHEGTLRQYFDIQGTRKNVRLYARLKTDSNPLFE